MIIGMPNVHRRTTERFSPEIGDSALHKHPLSRNTSGNIGTVRHRLVLADIKWAQYRGLGRAVAFAMIDRIDQHRNPEHVGQQDKLLPARAALLANAGQEIDRITPLVKGEIGFADEVVQRPDQFLHEEFDAPVRRLLKATYDGGSKFGLVELGHFSVLQVRLSRGGKPTPAAPQ